MVFFQKVFAICLIAVSVCDIYLLRKDGSGVFVRLSLRDKRYVLKTFSGQYLASQCAYKCARYGPECESFNFDRKHSKCDLLAAGEKPLEVHGTLNLGVLHYQMKNFNLPQKTLGGCISEIGTGSEAEQLCELQYQNFSSVCIDRHRFVRPTLLAEEPELTIKYFTGEHYLNESAILVESTDLTTDCICRDDPKACNVPLTDPEPQFGVWSACSVTCETGWSYRVDKVTQRREYRTCTMKATCPRWSDWSTWSLCNATNCDELGVQDRKRSCDGPGQGSARYCKGPDHQWRRCSFSLCNAMFIMQPSEASYGEGRLSLLVKDSDSTIENTATFCASSWTDSDSETACKQLGFSGGSTVDSDKDKDLKESKNTTNELVFDIKCSTAGTDENSQQCQVYAAPEETVCAISEPTLRCSVPGEWGAWTSWSDCSVTCQYGTENRTRLCDWPAASNGGAPCTGEPIELRECFRNASCGIAGVWNEWLEWTECTASCAGGTKFRERTCYGPFYGGLDCQGPYNETNRCNTQPCPIPGDWMSWTEWTYCDKYCGSGLQSRERECDWDSYGNLTIDCIGSAVENRSCNAFACEPIPVSCGAWFERGLKDSRRVLIDMDRAGEDFYKPFEVFCDMNDGQGPGYTVIGHQYETTLEVDKFEAAGEFQIMLEYNGTSSIDQVIELVDNSASCKQFLRWDCYSASMHQPDNPDSMITYWVNRDWEETQSWGGAPSNSRMCACGVEGNCYNTSLPCNCDENDYQWRYDEGWVTDMAFLPIVAVMAGDTGDSNELGRLTVGPLICEGVAKPSSDDDYDY